MVGQRVFSNKFGLLRLPEGGYGRDMRRMWWCRPPGGNAVTVTSDLVNEHDDGTITVTVAIGNPLELNGTPKFFLDHGIWRKV